MQLGIDCKRYTYFGLSMPKTSLYECSKWFAKSGKIEDSSERYQHSLVNFGRGAGMNILAFSLEIQRRRQSDRRGGSLAQRIFRGGKSVV